MRDGDASHVDQRDLGGEADDGVTLVVETAASRATGHLGELAAGQELATGVGVLGELLERHRTRGHVDPERQRLGGEDDREQVLDRSRSRRSRGRPAPSRRGARRDLDADESMKSAYSRACRSSSEKSSESRLGDALDLAAFLGRGEEESVASALVHGVVAGGAREDEDDDRQEVVALEGLEQFAASRRAKGRRRCAGLGALPSRTRAEAARGLHRVVDASRLVGETLAVEQFDDLGVRSDRGARPRGDGAG